MAMTREQVIEFAEDADIELILLSEDLDPAILGVGQHFAAWCVVYDKKIVIELLIEQMRPQNSLLSDDELHQAAVEHYEYNIVGGHLHDTANPVFLEVGEGS